MGIGRRASGAVLAGVVAAALSVSVGRAATFFSVDTAPDHDDIALLPDGAHAVVHAEGLTKIDALGGSVWSHSWAVAEEPRWSSIAVAPDGSIGMLGSMRNGPTRLALARVAADGNLVSLETLGDGDEVDLVATRDGGFIAVASNPDSILRLRPDGSVRWARVYGDFRPCAVAELADGRIVASGRRFGAGNRAGYKIQLLDPMTGATTWELYYLPVSPFQAGALPQELHVLPDGDVVAAFASSATLVGARLCLARIRPSVGVIWFEWIECPKYGHPAGIAQLADGTLCVAYHGTWRDVNGGTAKGGNIIGFTDRGDILYNRQLSGAYGVSGVARGAADEGPAISGMYTELPPRAYVARLDAGAWTSEPYAAEVDVSGCVVREPACWPIGPQDPGMLVDITPVPAAWSDAAAPAVVPSLPGWPCSDIYPSNICLDAGSREGAAVLRVAHDGGMGAMNVAWDTDGDGVDDAVGNPVLVPLAAGTHSIRVTLTDSCDQPAPRTITVMRTVDVPAIAPPDANDADADLVCDAIDNCDSVPNPDQADSDADGIGDACDDAGCAEISGTGVGPLTVRKAGAGVLALTWEPGHVTDVFGGDLALLHAAATYSHGTIAACAIAGDTTTLTLPTGDSYYLVADECAGAPSSLGRDSLGRERPAASPPCR